MTYHLFECLGKLKHLLVKMENLSNSTVSQSVDRSLVISNTSLDQPKCLLASPVVAAPFLNSLLFSDWSPGRLGFCMGVTIYLWAKFKGKLAKINKNKNI